MGTAARRKAAAGGKKAPVQAWYREPRMQLGVGAGIVIIALIVGMLFAFGPLKSSGPNRVALAEQVERQYWNYFDHLKTPQAYALLTPGVQQSFSEKNFYQAQLSLLESTHGVNAVVGKATVVGDCAQVQLALVTPSAIGQKLKAWQHLYWIDGSWHISDTNGQITRTYKPLTSCPTGT